VQYRGDDDRIADQGVEAVIPLAAEEVTVSKQVVETGRVKIARVTHEREQLINELLVRETVEISRTPIGQQVDAMPAVREEGDTTVIPIVEEVLVVERRLFLKEEVHVRRVRTTERHEESVMLRHQEAVITRLPGGTEAEEGGSEAADAPAGSSRRIT
jgi:uncharacterized protein (TIGR02271 family)